MSHTTLPCILFVKIDFSLELDSQYHEDEEKKVGIMSRSEK